VSFVACADFFLFTCASDDGAIKTSAAIAASALTEFPIHFIVYPPIHDH
jgi:hypothetical protein